jgi:hypothetical protein
LSKYIHPNVEDLDEGHNPCPNCRAEGKDLSGDNLMYYGEGGGYHCFSCGLTAYSDEHMEEIEDNGGIKRKKGGANLIKDSDYKKLEDKALTDEQLSDFHSKTVERIGVKYRGLSNAVCEELGVRWTLGTDGKPTEMHFPAHILGEDGEKRITGYKTRIHPKDFRSIGYVGKLSGFFGQTDSVAETLIITAGEIDLLSGIQEMQTADKYRKNYNVVTSPLGEDSTATMVKINYDWVNQHKKIVVCMDKDDAGEEAFKKLQSIIDPSKLFKANLRHKDLNDYLKAREGDKIAGDIYWNPVPVKTFGILGSDKIFDRILDAVSTERIPLPPFLISIDDMLAGGIPLGEVVNIISSVSTGKTVFINEIIMHWLKHSPHRVFIASLEDNVGSYGAKMASRVIGKNILAMRDTEERREAVLSSRKEVSEFLFNDDGSSRFDILDVVPELLSELKEAVLQAIKVLGCKLFLLDPLQSILGTKSLEEQADWMNFEEACRRDYNVTFINIAHTRKSGQGQKAHSEGGRITEEDIKGSSQISATATLNIIISRNKMAECEIEKNTTYISIPKNRTVGRTGEDVGKIYYSREHHTLFDFDYAQQHNFFQGLTAAQVKGLLDPTKSVVASPANVFEDDEIEMSDSFE